LHEFLKQRINLSEQTRSGWDESTPLPKGTVLVEAKIFFAPQIRLSMHFGLARKLVSLRLGMIFAKFLVAEMPFVIARMWQFAKRALQRNAEQLV